LPYQQAVVTPQSYGDESSLLVWFASPSLANTIPEETETAAVTLAVQAAKAMLAENDCLEEYDSLVFNVVDDNFWLWFSGSMRVADIPDLVVDDSGGGSEQAQGGGRGAVQLGNKGKCTWPEVAEQLEDAFRTQNNLAVFFYNREVSGNHTYTHWRVGTIPESSKVKEIMTVLATELACLSPTPNGLSATITGPGSEIIATAYLPLRKNGLPLVSKFSFTILEKP
jgi:hypothetical protein